MIWLWLGLLACDGGGASGIASDPALVPRVYNASSAREVVREDLFLFATVEHTRLPTPPALRIRSAVVDHGQDPRATAVETCLRPSLQAQLASRVGALDLAAQPDWWRYPLEACSEPGYCAAMRTAQASLGRWHEGLDALLGACVHPATPHEPAACAAAGDPDCLHHLALRDWDAARAVARGLALRGPQSDVAQALLRFQSSAQARSEGVRLGLPPVDDDGVVTVLDHFRAAGLLTDLPVPGIDPFPHDAAALAIAALMPGLGDMPFSQVVIGDGDVKLDAWTGTERVRTLGDDLGDDPDLDIVIGLVNTLSRERHGTWRALPVTDDAGRLRVLVGPAETLRGVADTGALRVVDPTAHVLGVE